MLRTPWGNADELRGRMLPPGGSVPAEEVVKNQRERLFAAMVATVARKGYEATTVDDIVELSGVSRSDFYEHFSNKEACFLETLQAILTPTGEIVAAKYDGKGCSLRTFASLIAAQPAAAKLCFVEAYAAGPAATEAIATVRTAVEAMYEQAFRSASDGARMPAEIVKAIVGGLSHIIHRRLCRDEAASLPDLVDELRHWSLGYKPPPLPLRASRHRTVVTHEFEGYTEVERICRATAEAVAEKGYSNATTADIAERAHISLKTFYAHFANKEEAVIAALEISGALLMAVIVPVARRAHDWRHGVRESLDALCTFLAAEPALAKLSIVEVYSAGPRALDQRDHIISSMEALIAPGFKEHPDTPAIIAEAVSGATYRLLREQFLKGGAASLPRIVPFATYMTIEPFVGPYEAAVIASDDRRPRRRLPDVASPGPRVPV